MTLAIKNAKRSWRNKPNQTDSYRLADNTVLDEDDLAILNQINAKYTHVMAFGDHHVVSMKYNNVTTESHEFQTLQSFKNNFLDAPRVAGRLAGHAWLIWAEHHKKLNGIGFYPNPNCCPAGVYNMFTGLAVQPAYGDCSPYLEHLEKVICSNNQTTFHYLIAWLAHLFQKPDIKPSVAVVLKAEQGSGKGTLTKPLLMILGMFGVQVNGIDQITGRFNSTVANKLLVFIDEAQLMNERAADRFKAIISEPTINLEKKGKDPEPITSYARFIIASNNERVLQAGAMERRYLVLEPDNRMAQDKAYFDRLHQWIDNGGAACLLDYLLNYDISCFDPRRAPITKALINEKLASMKPVEQFIYSELLKDKPFNQARRLPAGDLVNQFMLWCENEKEEPPKAAAARSSIGKLMQKLKIPVVGRSGSVEGKYYLIENIAKIKECFCLMLGDYEATIFD